MCGKYLLSQCFAWGVLRQEAPAEHTTAWAISEETRTYAGVDDADWCEWLS